MKKTKNITVKPSTMVSDVKSIKETFGKNTILIKGNVIFRCSTETFEKGPKCLLDLYLPKYGKMNKYVVKEDGVYELITEENYENSNFAQFKISEKVNIDASSLDFNIEKCWNSKKVTE